MNAFGYNANEIWRWSDENKFCLSM